jgi:hypothetical protein
MSTLFRLCGTTVLTIGLAALFGMHSALAAPPTIVQDTTSSAPVTISDSSTYVFLDRRDGMYHDVVCLAFVNNGARTATKVGFGLTLVDATGTVLATPAMWPHGDFPVGVRTAYSSAPSAPGYASTLSNGNCFDVSADFQPTSTFRVTMARRGPRIDVAAIVVSVRQVWYQDGATWQGTTSPQIGSHVDLPTAPTFESAVPNGLPVVTVQAIPDEAAPVRVTDAFPLVAASLRAVARGSCAEVGGLARPAASVRLRFTLLDRVGVAVHADVVDFHGPFDAKHPLCDALRGTYAADTFLYGPTQAPIGRVLISPAFVQFEDGSTWEAPAPARVSPRQGRPVG